MHDNPIAIISFEIDILFKNIQATFDSIPQGQMAKTILKWPLSMQFYHMLHSLDQWLVNPNNYSHPSFHVEGMNSFKSGTVKLLTKSELLEYYASIKANILRHISTLAAESLFEKPEKCKFTRLDLIIAQCRHVMYNLGLIHAMVQMDTGILPKYIGLSDPIQ
jgi:hypothetical protein